MAISLNNYGSCKILVEFHGSCSLVFCAVLHVSQFCHEAVSESQSYILNSKKVSGSQEKMIVLSCSDCTQNEPYCFVILLQQFLNAVKCNLTKLTTKSS